VTEVVPGSLAGFNWLSMNVCVCLFREKQYASQLAPSDAVVLSVVHDVGLTIRSRGAHATEEELLWHEP